MSSVAARIPHEGGEADAPFVGEFSAFSVAVFGLLLLFSSGVDAQVLASHCLEAFH